jgi:hypothetical protein
MKIIEYMYYQRFLVVFSGQGVTNFNAGVVKAVQKKQFLD